MSIIHRPLKSLGPGRWVGVDVQKEGNLWSGRSILRLGTSVTGPMPVSGRSVVVRRASRPRVRRDTVSR